MSNETENNGSFSGRDSKGKFMPGNSGKPVGAKNKLREKVKTFVETNINDLQKWFDGLDPEKKIKVINDLLPFCVSRLQSISETDDEGNPVEPTTDFTKWSDEDLRTLLKLQEKNGVNSPTE